MLIKLDVPKLNVPRSLYTEHYEGIVTEYPLLNEPWCTHITPPTNLKMGGYCQMLPIANTPQGDDVHGVFYLRGRNHKVVVGTDSGVYVSTESFLFNAEENPHLLWLLPQIIEWAVREKRAREDAISRIETRMKTFLGERTPEMMFSYTPKECSEIGELYTKECCGFLTQEDRILLHTNMQQSLGKKERPMHPSDVKNAITFGASCTSRSNKMKELLEGYETPLVKQIKETQKKNIDESDQKFVASVLAAYPNAIIIEREDDNESN